MRRRALVGAAAVLLAGALSAVVATRDAEAGGSVVPGFAAANMAPRSYTTEQAAAVARQYDVVSALPSTFRAHLGAMKAANPDLTVLAYMNGSFAQRSQGASYPETWYARSNTGAKVTSIEFGNFLMNPRHNGWVEDRGRACADLIASSGYDGCFVDMLGTAQIEPGYCSAVAVDPQTGGTWTRDAWQSAMNAIAATIKRAVRGRPVIANGLGSGTRYFAADGPSAGLLTSTDGALAEAWLRAPRSPVGAYPAEAAWKRDVDAIADAESKGKAFYAMTKLWTGSTVEQRDAWHRFALASFLLASGERAAFSFVPDPADSTPLHPWDRAAIGYPLGGHTRVGAAYRRDFTGGIVVANPGTVPATVTLPRAHATLGGRTVTSVVLGPHTGEVLLSPVDMGRVVRIAGADRVETAIATSRQAFGAGQARSVVLARSDQFADGLAGTPLASATGGPLLLNRTDVLDSRVLAEIRRVLPVGRSVHLLGGTAALSAGIERQLAASGYTIARHAGADRYATAVTIAREIGDAELFVVATGTAFPDALAGGTAAAISRGVVLLTEGSRLPADVAVHLATNATTPVMAVGGPAASAAPTAEPVVGADRYETAARLAERVAPTSTAVAVASGERFPDSLSGGAHAATAGAPLLLVRTRDVPGPTRQFVLGRSGLARALVFGGAGVISDEVTRALAAMMTR